MITSSNCLTGEYGSVSSPFHTRIVGSFRNDFGDGKENVKKQQQ